MRKIKNILGIILNLLAINLLAQVNIDTPNLSFEDGSLNGWKVYTGEFFFDKNPTSPTFGSYTYRWTQNQTTSRVQIISNNSSTYDPVINCDLKTNPTNKSVARIGAPLISESEKGGGAYVNYSAAEKIEYSFKVTPNNTLLSYKLAAVLHAPTGDNHLGEQRPSYSISINVVDTNGLSYSFPCSSYSSVASAGSGLVRNSNCLSSSAKEGRLEFMYQPWISAYVDLKAQIGKTVTISVSTHDCLKSVNATDADVAGGHSAHGYFWAETKKIELESFSCDNDDATIVAPLGFSSYTWTRSDGKPITINPAQPNIVTIERAQNVEGVVYYCALNDVKSNCGAITLSTTITPVKLYPDFTSAAVDAGKIQFTDASTADGDSITNYYWDFGDGTFSALKNPIHEYFEFKPFNVKLTVTSKKGCSKTSSLNVLPTKELIAVIFPPNNLQYNGQTKDFTALTNIAGFQMNIDYYIRYSSLPGTALYNSYSAPSNAGDYTATFELSYVNLLKYLMVIVPTKNFSITKAPLTVTVNDVSKTYGESIVLPREAFTQSIKPLYAGDKIYELNLNCNGLADTASVQTYPIVADNAIGLGVDNYDIQFVDGTLTVNPKAVKITAIDAVKTYGDLVVPTGKEFLISPNSMVGADSVDLVSINCWGFAPLVGVSSYNISAHSAIGYRLNNYLFTYVPAKLQVVKKNLSITANAINKTYGDSYTFTGTEYTINPVALIGTDTITAVQLSSIAGPTNTPKGDYPITIAGITGVGLDNYELKYQPNTFKVTARDLVVIAKNQEKGYGDVLDFTGNEFTIDNPMVNNDFISFVLLKSTGSSNTTAIGQYEIVASQAQGNGSLNYNISYRNAILTVNQKELIVTAASYEKEYGQKDPDLRYVIRDKRGIEYPQTLFSGKLQRVIGETPQNYSIQMGTLAIDPNYSFSFVEGNLTIKKALPIIDPSFSNDNNLYVVSDLIGTAYGDIPTGSVLVSIKGSLVSSTVIINGAAQNNLLQLPDSMVMVTVSYSGDDNYLPVNQIIPIYAIRYHYNGGELVNPIEHFDGKESFKLENPTRQQKFKFDGWFESPDFSGEAVRRISLGTNRDVDLYAKWVTTFDDLSLEILFNQVLAVANPQNREFIYHSNFKWSKDGVPLQGNKQYLGFPNIVPTGEYKVEIYYEGNTPIQLELKHTAIFPESKVYPNPVKKFAPISVVTEHAQSSDTEMQVYNALGQRLSDVTIIKQADAYQLKGLKLAGVYVLRILKNAKVVETHKLIVKD